MTFCYIRRSVSHSSITREASFTVDKNEHRDPQLYSVHRVRDGCNTQS